MVASSSLISKDVSTLVCLMMVLLAILHGHHSAALQLRNGAYEDLVIGLEDSVPSVQCKTILENLEATLAGASQYLFAALDGRAFVKSTTVVLPASWPDSCAPKPVVYGSGDYRDITVLPQGPARERIWTQQSAGCGQPGDQIYLGFESLTKRDATLSRSLVKEFAAYRYGVFKEQGYKHDPVYPTCYYDDETKSSKVTGCSSSPIKDNGICSDPNIGYNFTQMVDSTSRSSVMFAAEAPSVTMFCDEGNHDRYAPTKHNLMCGRFSTYDIIKNHPDFSAVETVLASSQQQPGNAAEIISTTPRIVYAKQNLTRYVLVIESTKDMLQRESWNYMKVAIRKWALFDLPKNSELGVLLAHESGYTKLLDIISLEQSNSRDRISSNIPYTSGESSQPACLHCALKQAISMLKDHTKYSSPARNVIVVIAPGTNWNSELDQVINQARQSKIRIASINYPEVIRAQPLDALARKTDGVAYTVTEKKYNIDTSMLSTYFQLTNVLYNVIERFYSGNPSNLPVEIHRRELTDDGRTSVTGSFVLDDNMGEPARFMLYTHNTESPLIRGLSLVSPSHQEFVSRSENLLNVKIISLAANITEPGTWMYTIERYAGNPQPHYVQVIATPHSRSVPVTRARFWTHSERPGAPLILLAEIKHGNWPVLGARVEVNVSRSEPNGSVVYSNRFELMDTGSGDPDITKGDGVYSRYFSAAPGGPGTYTFEATVTDNGNTAYTWHESSVDRNQDKPCCGSNITPTSSVRPLSPFQRSLAPITIGISSDDILKASHFAIGRVGDLQVQVKAEDMKAILTWTSPDMGSSKPARYEVKYASSLTDIVDNYETLAKTWEHASPLSLAAGSETTLVLDMTKDKNLLDKSLYFAVRAFPQLYSNAQAAPVSNWVRVLVPSPPPPPTVPPTYLPHDYTAWPNNQHNSVGIDHVSSGSIKNSLGIEVILPVTIGVLILAIILSLYCYFCVIKRRHHSGHHKKSSSKSKGLQSDKLGATVTIVPGCSPVHHHSSSQTSSVEQGYVNHSDLPDHHTIGVPINNFSFEDEPKKRFSLVHQQEQQLIEELKQQHQQQHFQNQQNLSVISGGTLQRNGGHTLSPYNSWSASQLLHEHERRYSPLDGEMLAHQAQHDLLLATANGSQIDHMSLSGQSMTSPEHHHLQTHVPPVPPLPAYSANGYPVNYAIYGMHQQAAPPPPQIYQSMQRSASTNPDANLQGSLSSVNSGEKKRRNVTMV